MNEVFSHARPSAKAGDTVTITPSETISGVLDVTGADTVHVVAEGPQTSLTADLIAGVYPAPGSEDAPDLYLPHIALRRRTLPWERRDQGGGNDDPWLALIVVSEADRSNVPGQRPLGQSVSVERKPVSEIGGTTETHLTGVLGIAPSTEVDTLRLSNSVWTDIRPSAADLPLLTHVKRLDENGVEVEHAIVVANRLPNATAPEGEKAPLHLAALISVERWPALFGPLPTNGVTTLLVLHHWTFRPADGGDFEQVVKAIRYRPHGGVLRFGNLPEELPAGEDEPLSGGFAGLLDTSGRFLTPLEHDQDVANAGFRGPLRPFSPPPRSKKFAIAAAPSEFENAPPSAPLDYSHAAAFELGRLLALADPGILEDLRRIGMSGKSPIEPPVAVNDLPDMLQKPDWVSNPEWTSQPWVDQEGESLVKDATQLLDVATADPGGILVAVDDWGLADVVQSVTQIGPVVAAPITGIDIAAATAQSLDVDFADVAQAAEE